MLSLCRLEPGIGLSCWIHKQAEKILKVPWVKGFTWGAGDLSGLGSGYWLSLQSCKSHSPRVTPPWMLRVYNSEPGIALSSWIHKQAENILKVPWVKGFTWGAGDLSGLGSGYWLCLQSCKSHSPGVSQLWMLSLCKLEPGIGLTSWIHKQAEKILRRHWVEGFAWGVET